MTEIGSLGHLAAYASEQVERITRMQNDLAGTAGTGESPRGTVRARTGPGGRLLALRIDPEALRLPAKEVAAEVAGAITAAQRAYAERADEIMAPILGMRPSEQSVASIERGLGQLEALTTDLERLARDRGLAG